MKISLPDALPALAVGTHERGSGRACIMNAISYLNGDTVITDMPECADTVLSAMAQRVNDAICTHRPDADCGELSLSPENTLLCPECTHLMWLLGVRLIGTSDANATPATVDAWRGWLRVVHGVLAYRAERDDLLGESRVLRVALNALGDYAQHGHGYAPPSDLMLSNGVPALLHGMYGEQWMRWRWVVDAERIALVRTPAPRQEDDATQKARSVLTALQFAWSMVGAGRELHYRTPSAGTGSPGDRLAQWLAEHLDDALTFALDGQHGGELAGTFHALLDAWDQEFRPGAVPYVLTPQRAAVLKAEIGNEAARAAAG